MDHLYLCTDDVTSDSKIAWIYHESSTITSCHEVCIGYRDECSTVYLNICTRPIVPLDKLASFSYPSRSQFREITFEEGHLLTRDSVKFYGLRSTDFKAFILDITQTLMQQANDLKIMLGRIITFPYCDGVNITDGEDILSTNPLNVAFYLENFLSVFINRPQYWGLRYMDVKWSSDIRTVEFIPFDIKQGIKQRPACEFCDWKGDKQLFLRLLYGQSNGDPIGPRMLGCSPRYKLVNGRVIKLEYNL